MTGSSFNTKTTVLIGDSGPTSDGSTKTATQARCEKKYQFAYVRKIQIPRSKNPSYFSFGSCFGAFRQGWFATKFATSSKATAYIKHCGQREAEKSKLPMDPKDEAHAFAVFQEYMTHWLRRPLPRCYATEYKVGPSDTFPLTGSLDDLSEYDMSAWTPVIGECKTTSGDIASAFREYEFGIQTLQYQALYRMAPLVLKNKPILITGHVFDITQKPEGKGKRPKFARMYSELRQEAVDQFVKSTQQMLVRRKEIKWDTEAVRSYQCSYQAGRARVMCDFIDLCKYGSAAAGKFILETGKSLRSHQPKPGKEKMPWE